MQREVDGRLGKRKVVGGYVVNVAIVDRALRCSRKRQVVVEVGRNTPYTTPDCCLLLIMTAREVEKVSVYDVPPIKSCSSQIISELVWICIQTRSTAKAANNNMTAQDQS